MKKNFILIPTIFCSEQTNIRNVDCNEDGVTKCVKVRPPKCPHHLGVLRGALEGPVVCGHYEPPFYNCAFQREGWCGHNLQLRIVIKFIFTNYLFIIYCLNCFLLLFFLFIN
jgi:hypothetical protein